MSGYLRSLSAQALGLGVSVKSAARLPYAALPAMVEQPDGGEASPQLDAARVSSMATLMNAADQPALSETEKTHAVSSLPFPRWDDDARNEPRRAHQLRAPAGPDSAAPSMTRPAALEPAELVEPARVPTPPPPILPAARFVLPPAFAPAPPAGSARTTSAHRHSTGSDATEVHISMGRIEVVANTAPAPAVRRSPAPRQGTVTLADYLRGGNRSRR